MRIIDVISELWKQEKLPVINGLIKFDGSFYAPNGSFDVQYHSINKLIRLIPSTLKEKNYYDEFSNIYAHGPLIHLNTTYFWGEGSWGGDGFLVALDSNQKIKWLFFSYEANPFENLCIEKDELHVLNNLYNEWIFPINEPEKLYFK